MGYSELGPLGSDKVMKVMLSWMGLVPLPLLHMRLQQKQLYRK